MYGLKKHRWRNKMNVQSRENLEAIALLSAKIKKKASRENLEAIALLSANIKKRH
jgi:hypothetical protein